jgi:hypothetical protein
MQENFNTCELRFYKPLEEIDIDLTTKKLAYPKFPAIGWDYVKDGEVVASVVHKYESFLSVTIREHE